METLNLKYWVEIIAALAIPIGVVGFIIQRIITKKGIGVRAVQFLGIIVIVPAILVLAIEGFLEKSAVGALIGALIGYLFSNIGKFDEQKKG